VGISENIGAGAVTCNHDGAAKHRTTIGDHEAGGGATAHA
jgi:bifunctional N-acetylglucosamine-1-phosphate-uridyltransferase/glucosamine-1-phosphate-acetyltransferase GlmU-like protein